MSYLHGGITDVKESPRTTIRPEHYCCIGVAAWVLLNSALFSLIKPGASPSRGREHFVNVTIPRFRDVSIQVGLNHSWGRRLKYGGATVADFDGDGYPDIFCSPHDDGWAQLYFNQGNGTFELSEFLWWADTHAAIPLRFSPEEKGMHLLMMQGGNNGQKPNAPTLFKIGKDRQVTKVQHEGSSLSTWGMGRGRGGLLLPLQETGKVNDLLLTYTKYKDWPTAMRSFTIHDEDNLTAASLRGDLELDLNNYAGVTDIDNDGNVEVVTWWKLDVFRLLGDFKTESITRDVLPDKEWLGVRGIAELDFDNDGQWDLYIAKSFNGDLDWIEKNTDHVPGDVLLRNVNGKYVDVTSDAMISLFNESRGATVGDFNNDGWIDILVPQYYSNDVLLLNNGNGTFQQVDAGFNRPEGIRGDMATAVDYDADGSLDIVLSEGDWFNKTHGGYYKVMRNEAPSLGNYLLVRVKNSRQNKSISLYAVVTIRAGNLNMMRRVGSPGTVVVNSYIELIHFGLGNCSKADSVHVKWPGGEVENFENVHANQLMTVGE